MKESTKRVIDWLTLPVLGLPAAVFWFDYINNTRPSKIWIVLLMLDIPFAAAALIWLGWRLFSILLREERTKRIIDWCTLIPLGFPPAALVWAHYTHTTHPPVIWLVLLIIDLPLTVASIMWLALRAAHNNDTFPDSRLLILYGWLAIFLLIRVLLR
jgi:hypothetical protein